MKVTFWGVRGSLPTPLSPERIRAKIEAVVQRIAVSDLENSNARERFISSLPPWIYGTVGGNSACVEIRTKKNEIFILDAGSGIRLLGKKLAKEEARVFHIFISHFHWDHIQGLPFFDPAYNQDSEIHFYSPSEDLKRILFAQMEEPEFPVTMNAFTKKITYHTIVPNESFYVGDVQVTCKKMSHPGDSYAYSFLEDNRKFIYATDVEIFTKDFERDGENDQFFDTADVLVIDSQYTAEEAVEKENWGHSAFCYAVDFAAAWNIPKVLLFHHDPTYDDKKVYSILQSARWYAGYAVKKEINLDIAAEGLEIEV